MSVVARGSATLLVAIALLGSTAGVAAADCALDERPIAEQVADAEVVFVGTVIEVRNDTTARFRVDEVWAGEVPAEVVVLGGPDEPGVATSVDRTWEPGTAYLVVPHVDGGRLHDDSCSPTRPLSDQPGGEQSDELAEARPASAHAPQPAVDDGGPSDGALIAVAGLVLVLAVGTAMVVLRPARDDR